MAFKLRSGNKTSFKMMGSSPLRDERTDETKKLDESLDQMDRAKLYRATQDEIYSRSIGENDNTVMDAMTQIAENRKNRGETKEVVPSWGNTGVAHTSTYVRNPSYKNEYTDEIIPTENVSIKDRNRLYEERKKGPEGDHGDRKTKGFGPDAELYGDITYSQTSDFDAVSNTQTISRTSTGGWIAPKVDTPVISLKPITPEIPKPKKETPRKARMPKVEKKKVKSKKVKKVRRPKGKKTRNLVTGGTNRTYRSTGTSRRKNRLIAGLTFWNSKD